MSVLQEISSNVKNMKTLEYSLLARWTKQIKEDLRQGVKKPFKEVIDVSWGDPHRGGVKPLTFVRQVLAACLYPQLMNGEKLPVDVRQRAQKLLDGCAGWSVGSYSATGGLPEIVQRVSEFISRRDGGVPSNPENIFLCCGSQWALTRILNVLVNAEAPYPTGVLTPAPCYSTTTLSIEGLGGVVVPYYLSEERGWELQVEELHRALESCKGACHPIALYVINPGNPAGQVQSRKSMQEVIRFASEKRLFLLADEVYQGCIYGEKEFVSYKRVLSEMGPPLSDTVELASFHSASKGFMGECGLRGGYVELVNLDPAVKKHIYTLFCADSSPPVLGQIALDLMTNPPQPGDPSYLLYYQKACEVINSLQGFSCQAVEGGAFAFPRIHLPAKLVSLSGVLASPGSDYGQEEGTFHIRFCILLPHDVLGELLRRLSDFHTQFMKDFS
uniref:alanine transaminase n=1 Tax=Oryzias latipes TaxID=8090 RepID=A0A3P9M2U8_ORYLA